MRGNLVTKSPEVRKEGQLSNKKSGSWKMGT